jgi:hypothetical protein
LLLAQRAGRDAGESRRREAIFLGLAGFLDGKEPAVEDREARAYLRSLWENWWDLRAGMERLILPGEAWRFAGVRPANHPHRRVGALVEIAKVWSEVRAGLEGEEPERLEAVLGALRHPFWDGRYTIDAKVLRGSQALIGSQRIADILLNVHYPMAVERSEKAWEAYLQRRGPVAARSVESIARRFLGPEIGGGSFLARAVHQQGLLQLQRDYEAAEEPEVFLEQARLEGSTGGRESS